MDREAIKSVIEKQKTIRSLALSKGIGSADIRVDEVVAENANETIEKLTALIELPMHPNPEINKEVNADLQAGEAADKAAGLPPEDFSEMFVSSIGDNWLPTAENINKLPEPLRRYIHDIETKCDPAGDAQQILLLKDTVNGQAVRIAELEKACDIFESNSNEASMVFEVLHRHGLVPAEKPGPTLSKIVSSILEADNNQAVLAIKKHQSQKGDDRCWLDDRELYLSVGLESDTNTALPSKEEFLSNCARFHASRQNPDDKYITVEQRISKAESLHDLKVLTKDVELKVKDKEIHKLSVKIKRTLSDLRMAIERQRKIGGREAGTLVVKYIIPAAKRLGWVPTKEEAQVGKANGRVRGRRVHR